MTGTTEGSDPGRAQEAAPGACDNCGICCLAFALPPFDANEELVRVPDDLLRRVDDYAHSARFRASSPCCWLDLESGKCKHHELRPALCRWFVPGCESCNELRREAGLPAVPVPVAD